MVRAHQRLKGGVEYDLHAHTGLSRDGRITGDRLIELAARRGLKGLGICEHDAFPDESLRDAARKWKIDLALGIEFTCGEVHVIGYNLRLLPEDRGVLAERFQRIDETAARNARRLVEALNTMGLDVDWDDLARMAGATVHSEHVIKHLVEARRYFPGRGRAKHYLQQEGLWLPDDHGLPPLSGPEVVALIHRAGGTALWAHPFFTPETRLHQTLDELVQAGIDGVEVVYAYQENGYTGPESNAVLEARMLAMLPDSKLAISGGSDSHYPLRTDEIQRPVFPGDAGITSQDMERLRGIFG